MAPRTPWMAPPPAAASAGLPSTVVNRATAYVAATGDLVLADATAGAFTVTLPAAPAIGALVTVKKVDGSASAVGVASAAGGNIDGDAAGASITSPQFGGVFEHTGSNAWKIVGVTASGGSNGTNGKSVLSTTGVPAAGTGTDGDHAYDAAAKVMYGPKAGGAWPAGVSLQGPAGTNGTNGANGAISQLQDEGANLTVRPAINFAGAGVTATDDAAGSRTVVTIPGGGGGASQTLAERLRDVFRIETDFEGALSSTSTPFSALFTGSGAAATFPAPDTANRAGVTRISTGTTATGLARIQPAGAPSTLLTLGGGALVFETVVKIPVLSDATERYAFVAGLTSTYTSLSVTDGAYFIYDEGGVATYSGGEASTASPNWQLVTANNAARTHDVSTVAVATGAWIALRIEVAANASEVRFYVNGVLVGTRTANIPASVTRSMGVGAFILKSAGIVARTADLDYLACEIDFTTARAAA